MRAESQIEAIVNTTPNDVHLPTTDGRELMLTRYTEPDADQRLLLAHMKLQLPKQPPPKIVSTRPATAAVSMPM